MKDAVSEMDPRSVFDEKGESSKSRPMPALEAARPAAATVVAVPAAEVVAARSSGPASGDIVPPEDEPPAS